MNGKHVTGVAKISMFEAHVHILAALLAIFVSQFFRLVEKLRSSVPHAEIRICLQSLVF